MASQSAEKLGSFGRSEPTAVGDRLFADTGAYELHSFIAAGPRLFRFKLKTLFLILFDEHGGTYDHVPPPGAVPPGGMVINSLQPGYSGFESNRLGVRVPAIVISAYTDMKTIPHQTYDHTVVPKMIATCFGLANGQLGNRGAVAPDLKNALTRTTPRKDVR